jgi:hypothetical protein
MERIEVKTKIIVLDEHTLGLIKPFSNYVEILHTSILRGSHYNQFNPILINPNHVIRLASEKDFDEYRVSMVGFDNKNEFEFN